MKRSLLCALLVAVTFPPLVSAQAGRRPPLSDRAKKSSPSVPEKIDRPGTAPQILELRQDQIDRLIQQLRSDKPKVGPFEVADLTSLLAVLLAAGAILVTWFIARTQKVISGRQTAVSLHMQLYGVEHFIHVVAPAAGVRMRWLYLPEPDRSEYRQEVVKGWAHYADDPSNIKRYAPESASGTDFSASHFREQGIRQSLTEHQALSAFLHFWSNLAVLIQAGLADRSICVSLFADAYRYNLEFVRQLRENVSEGLSTGDVFPAWIANTRLLEEILYGSTPGSTPKGPVATVGAAAAK